MYPIVALLAYLVIPTSGRNIEGDLVKHLLQDYDLLTRPVEHHTQAVKVSMGIALRQILEVNEKAQTLMCNAWLRQEWTDVNLRWNASDFENITMIRIPVKKLWHPDLQMINKADMDGSSSIYETASSTNVQIISTGVVLYVPPLILKSSCKMDVTWFPFDTQTCQFNYGSWTHHREEVDLQLMERPNVSAFDMYEFVPNGQWNIIQTTTKRTENYYDCCKEAYVNLAFTLRMKRRSLYYLFNLIFPCVLIDFLALLGFTLPPESGEKLTLGVTVLFSLIVFLNMIAESMPANSDAVPLLGTFFSSVMVMIAASVVSTIVVNLNQRSMYPPKEIRGLTRKIMLRWLPKMLLMNPLEPEPWKKISDKSSSVKPGLTDAGIDSDAEQIKMEWKYIALVVDRLCLFLSSFVSILAFAVLIYSAP